ncbi:DUF2716 domain-containing protein [Paenibacillus amylolyticus]|uniref:DUF2716 domain-containing protein n=1 Tax=Paenibacillus amylolyticus TaxID=1451 RepID=UPI0032421E55
MKNWIEINENEENEIWDKIYNDLKFKPSVHPNDWPRPITYNVSVFTTQHMLGVWQMPDQERMLAA